MQNKYFKNAQKASQSGRVHNVQGLIGSGNDRDCWGIADNNALCVKIAKPEQERPQNEIDYHYALHLKRKGVASVFMPNVYGWINTDKGPGLVFDLVRNFNGEPSAQILDAISSGTISVEHAKELVGETFNWLIESGVILADYGINNLLVQNYEPGKYRVVIVDGLGARNFGWKYKLNRLVTHKAVLKAREFRQMTFDLIDKHVSEKRASK